MNSLDPKGYVAACTIEIPKKPDSNEKIEVELGTFKQTGYDDFCTVSYPQETLEGRTVKDVAVPLDELKLSSMLNDKEETRKYVATTDNKKLALSQLIEAIKSKKIGKDREDYLAEVFKAKEVVQWIKYIKEIFGEIDRLKDQIKARGTEVTPGDSDLNDLTKLAENLKSLNLFSRVYSASQRVDISGMVDAYNELMPDVEAFLEHVNNQDV